MTKTPWHIWVVGILALLWNSGGAYDYIMTKTKNAAYLSAFTPEQLAYFESLPFLMNLFWAVAIWSSIIGSILILMRKSWAAPMFSISFGTMVVVFVWGMFQPDRPEQSMGEHAFTVVLVVVGLFLVGYTRLMSQRGVLK